MVFPIIYFTPSLDHSCLQFASTKIKMRKFRCVFMTYPESAKRFFGKDMTHPAIPPSRHPFPPLSVEAWGCLDFCAWRIRVPWSPSRRWIRRQHVHMEEEKSSSQLPLKGIIIHIIYIYICICIWIH